MFVIVAVVVAYLLGSIGLFILALYINLWYNYAKYGNEMNVITKNEDFILYFA